MTGKSLKMLLLLEGGHPPGEPGSIGWSGFIRYWAPAMEKLREQGVDLVFGTVRERSPLHPIAEDLGASTFSLDSASSRDYPVAVYKLSRLIRAVGPDVLHLSEPVQAAVGGLAGMFARRGIRLFHRHHTYIPGPSVALSRIGSRLAHRTMAVSEAAAQAARERDRVPEEEVVVVHNGIVEPRTVGPFEIKEARQTLGLVNDAKLVVAVGHLRPDKGHVTLVRALAWLDALGRHDVHLAIVGNGPEEERLRIEARATNLAQRVHLIGHQEDVALWYRSADAIALPSYRESFGLVAIESMACERPLVASRVDGIPEIVTDGTDGLLVDSGDHEALGESLLYLFDNPSTAQSIAARGADTFRKRFTVDAMVSGWLQTYESCRRSTPDP